MDVLNYAVEKYCECPRLLRKPMWRIWHKILIKFDKDVTANFMNYGYSGLNGDFPIFLKHEDEKNRYCIQLYDHVVNKSDIKNKDVLEVGSGRGGGASYVARYYKPKTYTGLDMSKSIIDFCNGYYNTSGLSFVRGIAEDQPFQDKSFDAVVNIESARCYKSLITFFREVYRVLKKNGHFLFADMINKEEVNDMKSKLEACGFKVLQSKNITRNVVKALDKDSERREILIKEKLPRFLKKSFSQFAGTKGTERYSSFKNGKFEYWSYFLRRI
jgi:ubiquinone/menaquinone biosynthesis C-methylase UbiE